MPDHSRYESWSEERKEHNRLYQKLYKRKQRLAQGLPGSRSEQNSRRGNTAKDWWARQTPRVRSLFEAIREDEKLPQGKTATKKPLTFEQSQTLHDWVDSVVMDTEMEEEE